MGLAVGGRLFRRTRLGRLFVPALALLTLAMMAGRSLFTRWRLWLWTEWATVLSAAIIAGCWIYDEFVARPALDRTVRVALLGTALLVLAIIAWIMTWAFTALSQRRRSLRIEMTASSTHAV